MLFRSRPTSSTRTSRPSAPTRSGARISPTCGPARAGYTWPWSSTCSPGAWSAGPSATACTKSWPWRRCARPLLSDDHRPGWSIIRTAACRVDSSGRRNTACVTGSEELVQSLGRCFPAKGLSRPGVEDHRHGREVVGAVHAEVGALRKVLTQQPVGVLIRAALPGAVGIAEVDLHASVDPQLRMLAQLRSLIPGQRASQLLRQGGDRARDGT